jgi:2-dehydro-3-deoxyphosphogluconate aldolase/(4S)-4-hydroxy-2-oxoglutarate aldolase
MVTAAMDRVYEQMRQVGVVPVVRGERKQDAVAAVAALLDGGISVAEVTMTVPDALSAIRELAARFGQALLLGAGTVTDVRTCGQAIEAGCRFVVTPVVNLEIIAACRKAGVCVIGGALTPTEIVSTHRAGAQAVKVFPAAALGGPDYFRLLRDPFPDIPLVPTGGVTLETLKDFLDAGAVFVGAGSDLVSREAVRNRDGRAIAARARLYLEKIRQCRGA